MICQLLPDKGRFWWESGRYRMTRERRSSNFGADIRKYWKCLSSSMLRIGSTRETNSPSWSRVVFKGRTYHYHRLSLHFMRCRRRCKRSNKMHSSSVAILIGMSPGISPAMSPAKTPVTLLPPMAWVVHCMSCIARNVRVCCVDYRPIYAQLCKRKRKRPLRTPCATSHVLRASGDFSRLASFFT